MAARLEKANILFVVVVVIGGGTKNLVALKWGR
jgi:hypothetical protein